MTQDAHGPHDHSIDHSLDGNSAHANSAHGNPAHGGGHAHASGDDPPANPFEYWEGRYGEFGAMWTGRVNATLAEIAAEFAPGRSLDLGCGEGGDVLWLASRGWDALGIDLSETAITRAREQAERQGLHSASFVAADLAEWVSDPAGIEGQAEVAGEHEGGGSRGGAESFDLVSASFLQSPVELPRAQILRVAASRVAPGGHLVLVSHAAPPQGAPAPGPGEFPTPESELETLALDPESWSIEVAEVRHRTGERPDGTRMDFDDAVVVARRRR